MGSKACVRVGNEDSEWFPVRVGPKQGCVMLPWLFNLYTDGVVREVNARVLGSGLKLVDGNDNGWELNRVATRKKQACFFRKKTVFFAKKTQLEKNRSKFCFFSFLNIYSHSIAS